jgi:hypothetical protein
MRVSIFVSSFVALATTAAAIPVSEHQKRQSGTFDYVVIGVSHSFFPNSPQTRCVMKKIDIVSGRYSGFGYCEPPLRRSQCQSRRD